MKDQLINKLEKQNGKRYEKSFQHYHSIDGLRTISCLSIIAMHIKANTQYEISGFLYGPFINSLTWMLYLFMMISGFGMCAGYLSKFQDNTINLENFYKRRYTKILPYFGFLISIALVLEPSITNIYEASIELLLLHGLLPNNAMNVLGVCWTLGIIFLFYLLFPAFTVLMKTKKRAWYGFGISLWLNFICQNYFFGETYVTKSFVSCHSFIYCIPLFIGGGIIYLYRQEIRDICEKFRWIVFIICVIVTGLYFVWLNKIENIEQNTEVDIKFYIFLIIFMCWLSYAVGIDSRFLGCKIMRYLSSISMEMYLAQMIIFRLVEKFQLLYVLGTGWAAYILTFTLTIFGLIIFIEYYKIIIKNFWQKKKVKVL